MSTPSRSIAIEDIATIFASEFVKETTYKHCYARVFRQDFIRMNYARRRKVVEKVLDNMEKEMNRQDTDIHG